MAGPIFDYVLIGGRVYDGAGGEPLTGDVAISGREITAVGELSGARARETIDAEGLAVSPGFIDAHTHSDLAALVAPLAESRLYAGVTTEICGNCGFSAGPWASGLAAEFPGRGGEFEISWRTQEEFFQRFEEAPSAINHAFLTGHGNVRRAVMGGDLDRPATAGELRRMREMVREQLEGGAVGMSYGLIYAPGCFAGAEELAETALPLGEAGRPLAFHVRNEAAGIIDSLEEALSVAERAGAPLHLSHLKILGRDNWSLIDELREWWASRGARGVRVTADRYPYTASNTWLASALPTSAFAGGRAALLGRLRDEGEWRRLSQGLLGRVETPRFWDSTVVGTTCSEANRQFAGSTLAEVAGQMGVAPEVAFRKLLLSDGGRTEAIFFEMSERNMEEILSWPGVSIGSDSAARALSGPTAEGFPHPRAFGTTGKFLRLIREKGLLDLPAAVHRLTGAAAQIFGLEQRGFLREGYAADVAVFDPDSIRDRATYSRPSAPTEGVRHLFVNGAPVLRNGEVTGRRPGRVLRHGR